MDRQSRSVFLIMLGFLLNLGLGCSNAVVEDIATTQAKSFSVLQQEVTDLATAQAESFDSSQAEIVSAATAQAEQFSALQEEEKGIATVQAETLNALQDVAMTQTELMGEVQQDVHVVATAVADQQAIPLPPVIDSLATGVGLLWQQADAASDLPLDFVADQSFHYDDTNLFLTDWATDGPVLFIWQQTTSTAPEDSLNEVEGTLYYAETLLSDNFTVTEADQIQLVGLQNILFLTTPDSDPVALARDVPQEVVAANPLQQTTTLLDAFTESGIPPSELDHLLILLESSTEEPSQLILLTLEIPAAEGPDPGDPNCGQYCARCYSGLCQPICWACQLFN